MEVVHSADMGIGRGGSLNRFGHLTTWFTPTLWASRALVHSLVLGIRDFGSLLLSGHQSSLVHSLALGIN
jgi:hypothetical protein